jgi:hypothetical protein
VCALYTPGVTFDIPEKLEGIVLVDMPASKWGAKVSCMHWCCMHCLLRRLTLQDLRAVLRVFFWKQPTLSQKFNGLTTVTGTL